MEYDLSKLLTPQKNRFTLKRLGRNFDGGYIVPVEICKQCNKLLSFGIADDISFEEDFRKINNNAEILAFDASIEQLPINSSNIIFIKKFIGVTDNDLFANINKLNIDIFTCMKMDIEGYEYLCLNSLTDSNFSQLQTLIVEFHLSKYIVPDRNVNDLILLLNRIEEYMFPIHVHQNNTYHGYFTYNGIQFSNSIEVTFLNNIYKENLYPIKNLDYPCVENLYDIGLSWIKNKNIEVN